ncbi:MAG: hypothetical protein MZV64_26470 [Ignavibacteriales bacterium]|nr:hypothetical protein [Ignavibacteriales bacterium]
MDTIKRFAIDEDKINNLINIKPDKQEINRILEKAMSLQGLELEEAAALLNVEDDETLEALIKTAKAVKEKIYGKRIVMFAPLYLSNYCSNCLYCGFRYDNKEIHRKCFQRMKQFKKLKEILNTGHKRILLVAGEDIQKCNLDYIEQIIQKYTNKKFLTAK